MQEGPGEEEGETKRPAGPRAWIAESKDHPAATAALVFCIAGGTILAGALIPESISLPRRLLGGAILGGLSWLLVMVGRLIDGE